MEALFRQLLADVDPEHINADASEPDVPAVREEQLLLQGHQGRWLLLTFEEQYHDISICTYSNIPVAHWAVQL